jgi:DNA-binding FadR family transcriptional regulator
MRQARRVAEQIQQLIVRDRLGPGERLPTEHELARRFRVSRPILREALQTLRTLGVVETRPKVGMRVLPFDPESLFSQVAPRIRTAKERSALFELRCLLEPAVLPLVKQRASRADLDRLEATLRPPLKNAAEGLARDLAFHEELWRLTGNPFIYSLRGLLLRFFADVGRRRVSDAAVRKTNAEHLAIVRALKNGDVELAQHLMIRNLSTYSP